MTPLIFLVGLLVLFWLLIVMPQRRRRQQQAALIGELDRYRADSLARLAAGTEEEAAFPR